MLDCSKLKTLVEDKLNVAEVIGFVSDRLQNIAGKGENAGYQHSILFPQYFQTAFSSGSLKVGIVRYRLLSNHSKNDQLDIRI